MANTLQGYLIFLIKAIGPMTEQELIQKTRPKFADLRKPNGETFKADLAKSVSMVL